MARKTLKVLVLDEEIPLPTNTGKKTRSYNLLSRLSQAHEIYYLCFVDSPKQLAAAQKFERFSVKVVPSYKPKKPKSGVRFLSKVFLNLFSPLPFIVSQYYDSSFASKIGAVLREREFDIIHCEISPLAIYLDHINKLPSVIGCHNVEAEIWYRYYDVERNPLKKLYCYLEFKKVLRFEKHYLTKGRYCVAVTERDKNYLRKNYHIEKVEVVPNGVDTDFFSPKKVSVDQSSIVFTGSMDWRPNQDAVRYFLESIWPILKAKVPELKFTIVGRNPPLWIQTMASKIRDVRVTGTVSDVRPYLWQSAVAIVPLRIGGGSRLKILEAMACGKALVSTKIGAEGLDVQHNSNILLADTPQDFARSVVTLLSNLQKRKELECKGRELVVKKYSWESLAPSLERVWLKAVN